MSCFQLLPSFHSTVCIFIDFINGFINIFFSDLEYIHNNYFEVIVYNSPILHFSWATAVGLLGFSEDTLPSHCPGWYCFLWASGLGMIVNSGC